MSSGIRQYQVIQRDLTEDEHVKLVHLGNLFWDELSRLCAKYVTAMPPEAHDVTVAYLGDKTSIYGSKYEDFLVYPKVRR